MGGKATGSQGTTATTAPNQSFGNAYNDLWRRAQGVANTPYQGYAGERVVNDPNINSVFDWAGQLAFGATDRASHADDIYRYLDEAGGMFRDASQFDPSQVNALQSPYTQQVVDATQNQFNEQNKRQQQGIIGNAASAGAWGGDRSAVAQGIVAGQQQLAQAPIIAGLYDRSYSQALDQYNKNRANTATQGINLANVGQMSNVANAQKMRDILGWTQMAEARKQRQLDVPYSDFLEQRAYPFQTTGWLANLGTGLGNAAGSSRTTSQSYSPAPLSTAAGLLSTGTGILGQTGAFGQNGWLTNGASNAWNSLGDWFSGGGGFDPSAMDYSSAIQPAADYGYFRHGGAVRRRHGGGIHANDNRRYTPARATGTFGRGIRGYADGGDVWEDDEDYDTGLDEPYIFDDADALATPDYRGTGIAAGAAPAGGNSGISSRYAVDLPIPERTGRSAGIRANAPWLALTRAGLGILGAGTLNAFTDIGRGGEEGLKTYQRETERADAIDEKEAATIGAAQRQAASLKQQSVRLEDAAREAAARLEQGDRRLMQDRELRLGDQQIRREEAQRRARIESARLALEGKRLEQGKFVPLGLGQEPDPETGKPVSGAYVLDQRDGAVKFVPNVSSIGRGKTAEAPGAPKTLDQAKAATYAELRADIAAAGEDPAKIDAAQQKFSQALASLSSLAKAGKTEPLVKVVTDKGVEWKPRSQAAGMAAPDEAMIVYGPDGKPIVQKGGVTTIGQLSKPTVTEIEKDLKAATEQLQQVKNIGAKYKPEFQNIWTKIGMEGSALKDKLGMQVAPETAEALGEFTSYRAEAAQYFADRLKAMSGAAVTEPEMKRQEAYLPNPGTGLLDGDSPKQLEAKLRRMDEFMTKATARLNYIRKNGIELKDAPPLDKMKSIIDQRGAALDAELKATIPDAAQRRATVRQKLSAEFGLVNE